MSAGVGRPRRETGGTPPSWLTLRSAGVRKLIVRDSYLMLADWIVYKFGLMLSLWLLGGMKT